MSTPTARPRTPRRHGSTGGRLRRALSVGPLVLVCLGSSSLPGQPIITAPRPTSTNQPDPLAAFMVSQPPIDTTAPVIAEVAIDPPAIEVGQPAVYRVVLNAMEQSIEWPDRIPVPAGCEARRGASGQFLQSLGGRIIPQTTFLYHLRPTKVGTFEVPSYTVRARDQSVTVPPATLKGVPHGTAGVETPERIELLVEGTDFYVGQDLPVQVRFAGTTNGQVRTLTQVELLGANLIVDRNFRSQRVEMRRENGVSRPVFVYNALAIPLQPGAVEVTAKGFILESRPRTPPAVSLTPGAVQPAYRLVDSEPLELNILPLPQASRPAGFTGAIGSFTVDPPRLSTNRVEAGDLITLQLTVRGEGNLPRILAPEIESQPEWQIFQASRENQLDAVLRQRGFVVFHYRLIPLDPGINATPAIPFSYFDPAKERYVDAGIDPVPIQVDAGPETPFAQRARSLLDARAFLQELIGEPPVPQALGDVMERRGRSARRLEPLHRRTWFAGVQVLPAALLGGLWFWDRRRRFLEDHPEVVLRRRAQKAVRRRARRALKAARRGDGPGFVHHAIQGFREACAPSGPAEPQALVLSDILTALPGPVQHGETARLVRRLFDAQNTQRYGQATANHAALLSLAPEVRRHLKELGDRL